MKEESNKRVTIPNVGLVPPQRFLTALRWGSNVSEFNALLFERKKINLLSEVARRCPINYNFSARSRSDTYLSY